MIIMAKKKKVKKKLPKPQMWLRWILLGLGLFSLIAVLFVPKLTKNPSLPCANSISCIKDLTGDYVPGQEGTFMGKKTSPPSYVADSLSGKRVLGDTASNKHIFVDLSTQKLTAYEGEKVVYSFPVSTGKWGKTPTGDFRIWIKLRYTRMEGGSGNDYYNLPNVPYVMFFYNSEIPKSQGFSLHGAYWHNNFGHTMSHGCVNIRPEDAEKLYYWANPPTNGNLTYATSENPGTPVTIYGQPPNE